MGDSGSVSNTAAKTVIKTSSAQPGEMMKCKKTLFILNFDVPRSFQETVRVDDDASVCLPRHLLLELRPQGPGGERGAPERVKTRARGSG